MLVSVATIDRNGYLPAPRVTPIMIEWKMIPASRMMTCQCWSLACDPKENACEWPCDSSDAMLTACSSGDSGVELFSRLPGVSVPL